MKCKGYKDIVPTTSGGIDLGDCGNLDIATGGIMTPILLFNASDIKNLEFYDDMRFDENLIVETIVTDSNYFKIDGSSIEYKESSANSKHQHTLTLTLNNIHPSLESILFDASNGKYIVCFRPKGQEYYRMFGWVEGASMTVYDLAINDSTTAYTLKFAYEGIYPLFQVNSDNFKLNDKYFTPIFEPLYNIAYCQLNAGERTGYAIAEYVVKINQAGQPLDKNDQLCSVTGLPQIAYKYINTSGTGGYEIIGTYNENGVFDGKPVKVYDETICPPNASGTISVTPTSINLNSTNISSAYSVATTNAWGLKEIPSLVTVTPNSGNANTSGLIKHNNTGGTNIVLFQNKTTKEIIQVYVNIYLIKVNTTINLNNGVTDFVIPVTSEGGSGNFTYITPSGLTITRSGNNLNCHVVSPSTTEQNYVIKITHADDNTETKIVNVKINGVNINPNWVQVSSYCKLV